VAWLLFPNNPLNLFSNIRGDIYGGLTTAVVTLPLALGFGVTSGAGAIAGLYGAVFVGFFAALFGGTTAQVSGPTGPMAVIMLLLLSYFSQNPLLAFTVVMMGGVIQILFGIFHFGRYINLVPYPVISGFMSGLGCIIIIIQIPPLLGDSLPGGVMLVNLATLPSLFNSINASALILGVISMAIVYLTPGQLTKSLPAAIIALIVGTLLSVMVLDQVPVIGEVPVGIPTPHMPEISANDLPFMLRFALVLAFLGSIDTLLTSRVSDSITRTQHDSDRELIGQVIGNTFSGLFSGMPGAGATMRTVVNIRAGAKTYLSGIVQSIALFGFAISAGTIVEKIPNAVLAGILFKVGTDIIDWRYLKRIFRAPKAGVIIMLTTLVLTVLVDLVTAVAVGMIMASLIFVKRMADTQLNNMNLLYDASQIKDLNEEETNILENAKGQIVLFHIEGPMSFVSSSDITRMLISSINQHVLIIDMSKVPFIDSSASIALEEVINKVQDNNHFVVLFGLRNEVRIILSKIGVMDLLAHESIVSNRLEALRRAKTLLTE
jgi:SulP family sulfate permease